MDTYLKSSFVIDPKTGNIIVNGQFTLCLYLSVADYLESKLYQQYSLDNLNLEKMKYVKRVLAKVPNINGLDWIISLDFKNLSLKTVMIRIARNSMDEIIQNNENDMATYRALLIDFFGKESNAYSFSWGNVRTGMYPDGMLAKILIRYKDQKPTNTQ